MRSWWHPFLVAGLLAGCASAPPAPADEAGKLDPSWRPGSTKLPGSDDSDGLKLEQAKGALDQRDVDKVLDRQVQSLVPCYEHAGTAQRYAAGDVRLRFFVASSGDVSNVLVVSSDVGNFDVERCLITEGRKLKFPPPQGSHATDFEYSLRFQASGDAKVVDHDGETIARDVAHLTPQLAPCGSLGPKPVRAVVYIQPGGSVSSVGLSCPSPIDMNASACAVEQIRKWRLPGDHKHIVRASFVVGNVATVPARTARGRSSKRVRRRG